MVGGQLVVPERQRRPPFWVWNAGLNQLYMSSYHLAPDLTPHYLDAIKRYRLKYLLGYTSSLYELAQAILRSRRTDLSLHVVLTNAEPLYAYQRDAIAAAFQCPVRETYGMAEIVSSGSECLDGRLHLWPCVGTLEVLEDGRGTSGANELIGTSLLNADMPLIRYRIGDRGRLAPDDSRCTCGRMLPTLLAVEGRSCDVLFTSDGRRIGRLDPVFKHDLPIHEAQIVQETLHGSVALRARPRFYAACCRFDGRSVTGALGQCRSGGRRTEACTSRLERKIPRRDLCAVGGGTSRG
jgi:phenylacetate-CoA ligase